MADHCAGTFDGDAGGDTSAYGTAFELFLCNTTAAGSCVHCEYANIRGGGAFELYRGGVQAFAFQVAIYFYSAVPGAATFLLGIFRGDKKC